MRILITLLCGVVALCPLESRAEDATLTIKASIISYADWQDRLNSEAVIVARLDKQTNRHTLPNEPDRAAYSRDNNAGSQAKFMVMDMNNDNVITRREYLISTGTPVTNSDFGQHDLDGDGFLSRFEVNNGLFSRNRMTPN